MPTTLGDQQETIRRFRSICNFPSVLGTIDCTHIRAKRVGGDMSEGYVNRKGYYSINVQVVCDLNLKIRDIVARWRGSAHDSRVFNESTIKKRFERDDFPGTLLGDSGYACTAYISLHLCLILVMTKRKLTTELTLEQGIQWRDVLACGIKNSDAY
ncbi:unnamed protein product [Parnassius apollo]|uniref:(apollo) hypothetical protein n=1 Tax=Parnassius apollo TaxID=110799 RepID=A0A8S3XNU1_PARAO|nr:unnamed protein product [Parnassius apollo]